MDLSPTVDVAVSVITLWTGPARFMTTVIALPALRRTTTYISRIMVSSLGRNESGVYMCTAIVRSEYSLITDSDPLSGTIRVTVGMANNYFLVS